MIQGIYAAIGVLASYVIVFTFGVYIGKKFYMEFLDSIGKDALGNDKAAGK